MLDILRLEEISAADRAVVGGKAFHLGVLLAQNFPVPAGFAVTTQAYRRLGANCLFDDEDLAKRLRSEYESLGGGPVAVRSSAAIEDGPDASFAGVFESTLNVVGPDSVLAAIANCWNSARSPRVLAYCREHGLSADLDMAVLVQRMAPTEIAGVVFTADPNDPAVTSLLIETSDGREGLPPAIRYDRKTLTIQGATKASNLNVSHARELAEFALRIEQSLGQPLDIEWSYGDGQFWILQVRPITARGAIETARVRLDEIKRVRKLCSTGQTHWVRDNLIESLPTPTPMTWALLKRLLSPSGGMGLMAADFGLAVNHSLPESGVYDLIAGRPYRNVNREMHIVDRALTSHPSATASPALRNEHVGFGFWLRLPGVLWRLARSSRRMAAIARTFPDRFRNEVIPAFERDCRAESEMDYAGLLPAELFERIDQWAERTLVGFGRDSLKPGAFAGIAQSRIRGRQFGRTAEPPLATIGARVDPAHNVAAALRRMSDGTLSEQEFILHFGHRGPYEMELSQPRWTEAPPRPCDSRHLPANSTPAQLRANNRDARMLAQFAGLRETAKHYFMLGYQQLRRLLLEVDRRYELRGGVFFLTPVEFPRLAAGDDLSSLIAGRRRQWRMLANLYVPAFVSSEDLEAIGRTPPTIDSTPLVGVGLSPGVVEGVALVLREPDGEPPIGRFILVCPSVDPIWTSHFVNASGIVAESGGVLSHGAIIAREFGLPAVAGIANAMCQLKTGQRLRIDGGGGTVTMLGDW